MGGSLIERLYEIKHFIKDKVRLRNIKFLWQRLTRGWSDDELWGLDFTIAKWLLPRLKGFKEQGCSFCHPCDTTPEEWKDMVDKMILTMELMKREGEQGFLEDHEYKFVDEGLELFGKRFRNLWW